MNVRIKLNLIDLLHLECFPIKISHIIVLLELIEVVHEVYEFFILAIIFEGGDGNTVGKLSAERKNGVIYYNHILEVSILEHS